MQEIDTNTNSRPRFAFTGLRALMLYMENYSILSLCVNSSHQQKSVVFHKEDTTQGVQIHSFKIILITFHGFYPNIAVPQTRQLVLCPKVQNFYQFETCKKESIEYNAITMLFTSSFLFFLRK